MRGRRNRLVWLAAAALALAGGLVAILVPRGTAVEADAGTVVKPAAAKPSPEAQAGGRRIAVVRPTRSRSGARRHRAWNVVYAARARGTLRPSARGIQPRLYVPNSAEGTLDVIEPWSGRVLRRLHVGAVPHHVTPSWNMKRLYVNNTEGNSLTVLAARTGRLLGAIPVEDPYNLYFTPDGKQAVVVAERYRRLDFRDPHNWRLIASVPIPGAGPDHLDFSADGRSLVISTEWDGQVFRVDVDRHKVTGRAEVGGLPVDVKLSPDGSLYYVANQGRGGVSAIDADDLHEVAFVSTGAGAHGLCVNRNARYLYVSNRLAGSISVIALRTRKLVRTWHVGGSPDMLQLSLDGKTLWVSNRFHGSVSAIRIRDGRVLRTIPTGAGAHGLTFFPQPGRYSVGHNGVYR